MTGLESSKEVVKKLVAAFRAVESHPSANPDIGRPSSHQVMDPILVKGTRGYIERICTQINGSYESGYYDACAVMIRRFIETLIVETFELKGLATKIRNPSSGDYYFLKDLISIMLNETSWSLGRNARKALPNLKDVGDKSAHSRRFCAVKSDIDGLKSDLRVVVQELTHLSGMK